jgi:DNA-binding response OmpR family regulator
MTSKAHIPYPQSGPNDNAAVVQLAGDLQAIKSESEPASQCRHPSLPPGILVVDDEPAILSVLESALRRAGFQVWSTDNGYGAVELYCMHWEVISVVLLDVQMPGIDGPRTLCGLKKVRPAVHCCFMTGNPGHYSEADLLLMGAVRVFRKPFAMVEVIETLRLLAKGAS